MSLNNKKNEGGGNIEDVNIINNVDCKEDVIPYEITDYQSFDQMGLKKEILKNIYKNGFETPSIIQKKAIKPFIDGYDCLGIANSGFGKSLVECCGILNKIDTSVNKIWGVLLAPTRELATQLSVVMASIATDDIKISLEIGGSVSHYNRFDKVKPHVIVGTPGRVLDLLNRKILDFGKLSTLVLDECDEILSRGFIDQIYDIFQYVPINTQVGLFSATYPPDIEMIIGKIMKDPVKILVKNEDFTLEGIKQFYVSLEKESHKFETLCDLYDSISITQCIIYCNTKKKVRFLAEKLQEEDFIVSCILGDMKQSERNDTMKRFRKGDIRILITTDMLARGIDVQQVSLVVNYDIPFKKETYIHRIGRSGRFGRKGVAINFVMEYDGDKLKELQEFYNTDIKELPVDIGSLL
jgi:translation initiation factor 4A